MTNNGLSTKAVSSLSLSSDGLTLYAGTDGGGVFRLSVHDQEYFDTLAPTPTPILSSTSTPTPNNDTPVSTEINTSIAKPAISQKGQAGNNEITITLFLVAAASAGAIVLIAAITRKRQ